MLVAGNKKKVVAFRVDASIEIGTGHVMRCLTLAEELKCQGHECLFICRDHEGHLGKYIIEKGFTVFLLKKVISNNSDFPNWNVYANWLGIHWEDDALQTLQVLAHRNIDWLVVDHYALDARWEQLLTPQACQIMVIDDLADRPHICELLLDQTFGRKSQDYNKWLPKNCKILCGSDYALLRQEFSNLRSHSLERRKNSIFRKLLITMGGVDKYNVTGKVMSALCHSKLPKDCNITVVMGSTAPWISTIKEQAKVMPWSTNVLVGVNNMAELMAASDVAIGAAGSTSWERCCLGLPAILLVLAENQLSIADALEKAGASEVIQINDIEKQLPISRLLTSKKQMHSMSNASSKVTSGNGVSKIINILVGDS